MSKWISVEKRLPTDDKLKVIKYAAVWEGVKTHLGIQLARYYVPSNQKTQKYWSFGFRSCQPTVVTHWADLPEGEE